MARIGVGARVYDIDLAAFDKDGTLIDFHRLWGTRARLAVEAVRARLGEADVGALYDAIGYDAATEVAAANGPLAFATVTRLGAICAEVLCRQGLEWHQADVIATETFAPVLAAAPTADQVKPAGDVIGLFGRLGAAGVRIAIVTSDERRATRETLRLLGVLDAVAALVCGDDPIASKPAPDALHYLSRALDVPLARIMMVGDTPSDMAMGASAGAGCRVAVLGGTGRPEDFAGDVDAVLPSIDSIRVLG
jgi:phosphoglycolate phosphatase-like HAD superfamily hydrolase